MMKRYDCLVVGAGIFGATVAERLANAVKLYKDDTLLWEVHQKRQRGRK